MYTLYDDTPWTRRTITFEEENLALAEYGRRCARHDDDSLWLVELCRDEQPLTFDGTADRDAMDRLQARAGEAHELALADGVVAVRLPPVTLYDETCRCVLPEQWCPACQRANGTP
jgi:hypothetical protein